MKNIVKIVLILAFGFSLSFAAKEENVLFSKDIPKKYNEKVYRKTTILFTEARLTLQKRYKKYLTFIYDEVGKKLKNKKKIKKYVKSFKARYYVTLDIKEKKNRCNDSMCEVKYIVKVYDTKKNKMQTFKFKAIIKDNEFADIDSGHLKLATKKLVKFLKR